MKRFYTNNLFIVLLSLFVSVSVTGQISQGGLPRSFETALQGGYEEVILASPDVDKLLEEDFENASQGIPYRNGVSIIVDRSVDNSGTWQTLEDGTKVWRLKLTSSGARGLAVYYDQFWLPAGGELFLYNEYKDQVIGAFTEFNNSENSLFATEYVQGESVTLEYNAPSWVLEDPVINISEVAYGYKGVSFLFGDNYSEDFGDSWWCHINVNCSPEGDNWQDEKRGAARILIKIGYSYYWCSGSLVNNTSNDGTPFFLTAAHCGEGASTYDMNQWIFYFNYEASGCSNPGSSPSYNSLTGATFKANDPTSGSGGSDFLLVLLNSTPPLYYNPYYNGWNRSNSGSPNGVSIHHPAGDIKKISTYLTSAISSTSWNGLPSHWRVSWSYTTNGRGVVEGGSSGSPLFDNNGRIAGTLTGGYTYNSCSNPSPAFYGKFWYHWDQNGSATNRRLKDWLDPGNTGATYLDGYDPNQAFPPGCSSPLSPSNGATNVAVTSNLSWAGVAEATGYKIYFGTDNPPTNIENGTDLGNATTYNPAGNMLYNQQYYWKIVPYNQHGDASGCQVWYFVTQQGLPSCSSPVSPTNGQTNVQVNASLEWTTASNATGYRLYLGTDYPPTNLVNGADLGNVTSYSNPVPLNYSATYYWKIAPYNAVGTNTGCSIWSFVTQSDPTVTTFPWMEPFVTWPPDNWNLGSGPYYWIQYGGYCAECPVRDMTLGTQAIMTTPPLNISALSNPELTFSWSHLYNPTYPSDFLEVLISGDMGSTWSSIWLKAGSQLNSNDGAGPDTPGSFVDETVNLSAYNSKATVLLRFRGYSGTGSDIFVNYVLVGEGPQVPVCTTPVYPLSGATDVAVDALLGWYHASGADGYKIFFGTDNPPTNIENGTDLGYTNAYDPPGNMNYSQLYYWKIVPYNTAGDASGCSIWNFTTASGALVLDLKAFLQGPYDLSTMGTDLNTAGNIPLSQPYSALPWNYSGTENVTGIPNANIVDWILVELRDAPDAASAGSATMIDRQAAFILSNGTITGIDGAGMLTFPVTYSQNLFAVLWHRNHIGIMSSVPLSETGGVYSYDFSADVNAVHGGSLAHREVATGVWAMTGADGDANGEVNNGDKNDVWIIQAGSGGYLSGDFNMDVQVNNGDKNDLWVPNTGSGGQVPDLYSSKCFVPE